MTTPPTDGDQPQDPQNPYGQPSTPPPPANPYGEPQPPSVTPPPPAQPYGQPEQPAYGQTPPPAYGQQPPAYGQQPPAYGQPQYPGGQGTQEPGKGLAIAALIVSFFGCTCLGALVAIPMSIVVLRRGKDGRNHGKGLAIAALIISVVSLLIGVLLAVLIAVGVAQYSSVDELKAGECITAKGLTSDDKSVSEIKTVGCSTSHDGEVLATSKFTAEQASGFSAGSASDACNAPLTAVGKDALLSNTDVVIVALTTEQSPDAGDKLVCVAANADGSKLTSKFDS